MVSSIPRRAASDDEAAQRAARQQQHKEQQMEASVEETLTRASVSIAITSEHVTTSSLPLDPPMPMGGLSLEESEERRSDPFGHIDQMMYLERCQPEQVRTHPAFEHLSQEERELVVRHYRSLSDAELGQVKLAYLANHLSELAESATYNLVEIGKIIAMGNLVGLHKLTGCESMYEWARTALHVDKALLSFAVAKYNAWLYVREYGYGVEALVGASETHVQAIRDLARDIHRQQEEIKRRKLDERRTVVANGGVPSPVSPPPASSPLSLSASEEEEMITLVGSFASLEEEGREEGGGAPPLSATLVLSGEDQMILNSQVAEEYQAIAHAEIGRILNLPAEDLAEERSLASGSIMRPHLSLTVTYNPETGNLEGMDPRTGARTGAIFGHLTEAHLRGLAKGQVSLSFRLKLPEGAAALVKPTLSTKDLGNAILEHCPPTLQEEGEDVGDGGRGGTPSSTSSPSRPSTTTTTAFEEDILD